MGISRQFQKVKLFCGFIYHDPDQVTQSEPLLEKEFSGIDSRSDVFPFDCTSYYDEELGKPLFRRFVSFSRLVQPDRLPEIKRFTNDLENRSSQSGRRRVNLDPGFLSNGNVVIATTKDYYHRIPLNGGIYAHLEYIIKRRKILPLDWTYPDFRSGPYIEYFTRLLALYREALHG
jgi:hypothetical protein